MPALPQVNGARVVRALQRAGFEVVRITGSHHIMKHPDGRAVTVPVHASRDIRLGTLRSEVIANRRRTIALARLREAANEGAFDLALLSDKTNYRR